MLANSITSGVLGQMSGGLFYSGFLLLYGFDINEISILLLIPSIAPLLNLLSPSILERFKRRKAVLAITRLIYFTINILCVTLLPSVFGDDFRGMKIALITLIIISNSINALFSSGYSAWHANFLPDNVRADYFTSSSCINSMVTYGVTFGLSLLTDSARAAGSEQYETILLMMRYVAYLLAIIDVIILIVPKEYDYPVSVDKPRFKDVLTLPMKNRRFALTMLILFATYFATNVHTGHMDTYILNEVGVPYSLTNGINALYFLFFIIFGSMWKKFIAKNTWFRALGLSLLIEVPSYVMLAFVNTENYLWLYVITRLYQHVLGVVRGTIVSSLVYVNLPDTDRTNYLALYTIVINAGAFLGKLFGTEFYKLTSGTALHIFSAQLTSVPMLFGLVAVFELPTAFLCLALFRKVTPEQLLREYDIRHGKMPRPVDAVRTAK